MIKILKFIARLFFKITGLLPYLFYLKPKFIYSSEKAKKEFKDLKNGAILVSNHTRIFDYYVVIYLLFFKVIHTFVADVVYKNKCLSMMNSVFENIKIYRNGIPNHNAINEASLYLRKRKTILIFPEGKLEDKKGKLESFSNTASLLSIQENKKIIPMYIDGNYGFFKRVRCVIGEAIYPSPETEEISLDEYTNKIRDSIITLKSKAQDQKKHKTKTIFTFKYWLSDFVKILSIPFFYLVFFTKKYYIGDRKEVKKALKYNCLIAGNHYGPCDPLFIYMFFYSRRVRLIATEQVFEVKGLKKIMKHSGAIKYHRDSMNHIDVDAFKDAISTLNANGVVGIFPEGHINFSGKIDDNIKEGAASLSLITNSPIIPFMFVNQYSYLSFNKVLIGEPIYPSDYFENCNIISNEQIKTFNDIIYNKYLELYKKSLDMRGKNGYRQHFK